MPCLPTKRMGAFRLRRLAELSPSHFLNQTHRQIDSCDYTMKTLLILAAAITLTFPAIAASEPFMPDAPMIKIWPGIAPGSEGKVTPEQWLDSDDSFHRVTNVHEPSLTI